YRMRRFRKYAGLFLLMAVGRYAPLQHLEAIFVSATPASGIVTGSLDETKPAVAVPGDDASIARARSQIDITLADAQSNSGSQYGYPGQQYRGRGNSSGIHSRRDDGWSDGIFVGGTGLLAGSPPAQQQHALVEANPDSFVVICEAGCRSGHDEIVYKISKASAQAAEIAKHRMEVTAASTEVANSDDAVVCIAGCYDDDTAARRHASAVAPSVPSQEARVAQATETDQDQELATRHLISLETHVRAVQKRVDALAAWSRLLPQTSYASERERPALRSASSDSNQHDTDDRYAERPRQIAEDVVSADHS
ncbi:MAG: hypothetical protein KDJ17_12380, partial [Hyphomicrobiaceae bacterium]|nr:hypothetical protein [Hyphomicrobiaceae bacterium]